MSNPTRSFNPPVWDAIYSATFSALYVEHIREKKLFPTKKETEKMTSFAMNAADDGVNELWDKTRDDD